MNKTGKLTKTVISPINYLCICLCTNRISKTIWLTAKLAVFVYWYFENFFYILYSTPLPSLKVFYKKESAFTMNVSQLLSWICNFPFITNMNSLLLLGHVLLYDNYESIFTTNMVQILFQLWIFSVSNMNQHVLQNWIWF